MIRYVRLTTRPSFVKTPEEFAVFAVYDGPGDVPAGWVSRSTRDEWVAWNQHGDFWVSYRTNRAEAVGAMLTASWREFVRRT